MRIYGLNVLLLSVLTFLLTLSKRCNVVAIKYHLRNRDEELPFLIEPTMNYKGVNVLRFRAN